MKKILLIPIILFLLLGCGKDHELEVIEIPVNPERNLPEFNRIVNEIGSIQLFRQEASDCAFLHFDQTGGVTFTGSSTITRWSTLVADFPALAVRNMGIGGSWIDHLIAYHEWLIFHNEPEITVIYIGDNDPYGLTADDFKRKMDLFIANYLHRLPASHLVLLSLKPSPRRSDKWPFYQWVNEQYRAYAAEHDRIHYVDIWSHMAESETASYFQEDMLHLNGKGYEYLVARLSPLLNDLYAGQ